MKNYEKDLGAYYHSLSDEELIRLCAPGNLTEEARSIAEAEVRSRGLALPEPPESQDGEEGAYRGDFRNVARYLEPTEAHLLRAYLESCGIPAVVADAHLVQANAVLGGAVGGTSLRVPEAFVPEALQAIDRFKRGELQVEEQIPAGADIQDSPGPRAGNPRLKTYRVYCIPGQQVPVVVKDGFSWAAFLIGPLWFLANRMWLNFLIVAGLVVGGSLYFAHHRPATKMEFMLFIGSYVFYLLVWFFIGKWANSLLAAELEERGYRLLATVKAENPSYARDEAGKVAASRPGGA